MYYAKHRIGMRALCFAVQIFCISINNLYLIFEGELSCLED
jgi:hypothetical protein